MNIFFLVVLVIFNGKPASNVTAFESEQACMKARAEALRQADKLVTQGMLRAACIPVAAGPQT